MRRLVFDDSGKNINVGLCEHNGHFNSIILQVGVSSLAECFVHGYYLNCLVGVRKC